MRGPSPQGRARHSESGAAAEPSPFGRALIAGLSASPRSIPCQFFYDAEGSRLFEAITELAEYYPTRTEIGILKAAIDDIAAHLPERGVLVELGSGSSRKTEILLDRLADRLAAYVPVDVSEAALDDAVQRLAVRYPRLAIRPVVGAFDAPLPVIPGAETLPRIGFFPGSTIGNLTTEDAIGLLSRLRQSLGADGSMLIGADLVKDAAILVPAYDDAQGVTAAFNKNVLARANRELGADFDLDGFAHEATWNAAHSRIEMHLVSRVAQTVRVLGHVFAFRDGERILTEHSHKYTIERFREIAGRAGWAPVKVWTDDDALFSVHLLS